MMASPMNLSMSAASALSTGHMTSKKELSSSTTSIGCMAQLIDVKPQMSENSTAISRASARTASRSSWPERAASSAARTAPSLM